MLMTSDSERIAVLEANQRHMERKLDDMSVKVTEMHEILLQAKGAKFFIIGIAAVAGALTAWLTSLTGYFSFK